MDPTGCLSIERLNRLLAGDLPVGERDRASAHLDGCPLCQERMERLLADDSVLTWRRTAAARSDPGPPDEFLSALRRLVPLVATSSITLACPAEGPAVGGADGAPQPEEPEPLPERIGGYEILGVLGRGGMSVVYKARQPGLGRIVALKRLSPRDQTVGDTARFLREAAAVARMHHPNIVQVYEVGEDEGRPFLALEYVPGGTLAEFLNGTPADPLAAADLLEKVARAVQHAHERGIVHRDLKPSNILLSGFRGQGSGFREEGSGDRGQAIPSLTPDPCPLTPVPKVSDFGLARAVTEDQSLTLPDVVVGTPAYLAPEVIQQAGSATPAADVYALGVLLYEMLTGRPPLIGPTTLATLRLVEAAEPVPPTRLQPHLPRDLETICLTCLFKDPRRRYPSAQAVAEELVRFQGGRPIQARRVGRLETGWLWCRRNPVVASLCAALVASVLTGLAVALVLLAQAHRSADDAAASATRAGENEAQALAAAARADASARLANDRAYRSDLQFANQMWVNRQQQILTDLLDGQRPERTDGVKRRGFEWHFLWAASHPPHRVVPVRNRAWDVAVRRDGAWFAVALGEPAVELLSADGKTVRTLTGPGGQRPPSRAVLRWEKGAETSQRPPSRAVLRWEKGAETSKVIRVCVSADGRLVAGGSDDGTALLWEADTGRLLRTLAGHRGLVAGLSFHPDGRTLVTAGLDGTVRVWPLDDRAAEPRIIRRPGVRFHCAAVSPDGKRLAVGASDGTIRLWDTDTWTERTALRGHAADVLSVRFAPDSATLASGSRDRTARVWNVSAGKPVRVLPVHLDAVFSVCFSPGGRSLATASLDRSVVVTDVGTGLAALTLLGHSDFAVGVAFAPDGKTLISAGWDQTVRLWDLTAGRPQRRWRGHTQPVRVAAFAPKGGALATGSLDGTVRFWDPTTGAERQVLGGHSGGVLALALGPEGRLATAAGDKQVRVWDSGTGQLLHTLAGATERINDLKFGPGGRFLAGAGEGGTVYIWDAAGGWGCRVLARLPAAVTCVRFDPTGASLAAGCRAGTVTVLDVATGRRKDLPEEGVGRGEGPRAGGVTALDFSPDGRRLAVALRDRSIRIRDGDTGKVTHTLRGHVRGVTAVCFSPDSRRLFSGSQDQTVRVWHAGTGQPLVTLTEPDEVTTVAVDTSGQLVASAGPAGLIGVRRANPYPDLLAAPRP